MPRISDPPITPKEIWEYATRTLTAGDNIILPSQAFPFANPAAAVDLPNVQAAISPTGTGREARLDNLDALISSRMSNTYEAKLPNLDRLDVLVSSRAAFSLHVGLTPSIGAGAAYLFPANYLISIIMGQPAGIDFRVDALGQDGAWYTIISERVQSHHHPFITDGSSIRLVNTTGATLQYRLFAYALG